MERLNLNTNFLRLPIFPSFLIYLLSFKELLESSWEYKNYMKREEPQTLIKSLGKRSEKST